MYLKGLGRTMLTSSGCVPICDANNVVDKSDPACVCIARGGIPEFYRGAGGASYMGTSYNPYSPDCTFTRCNFPPAAPVSAAPPITVTTSVQSQVSPQISPNLVQQQQPQGSPVTTGAVSSPSGPSQTTNDMSAFQQLMAQQADEQKARDAAMLDAFKAINSGTQQPTPAPVMSPDVGPAPDITTNAPIAQEQPLTNSYLPILGIVALIGIAVIYRKRKRKGN